MFSVGVVDGLKGFDGICVVFAVVTVDTLFENVVEATDDSDMVVRLVTVGIDGELGILGECDIEVVVDLVNKD